MIAPVPVHCFSITLTSSSGLKQWSLCNSYVIPICSCFLSKLYFVLPSLSVILADLLPRFGRKEQFFSAIDYRRIVVSILFLPLKCNKKYNVSYSTLITLVGEERVGFLLSFTRNFLVSVLTRFLFLKLL